jgi:hypothetical protein
VSMWMLIPKCHMIISHPYLLTDVFVWVCECWSEYHRLPHSLTPSFIHINSSLRMCKGHKLES